MKIQIVKFEPYYSDYPIGFSIGYQIYTDNSKSFYKDIILSLDEIEGKDDNEILEYAWINVKNEILNKVAELDSIPSVIGTIWNPPIDDVENQIEIVEGIEEGV